MTPNNPINPPDVEIINKLALNCQRIMNFIARQIAFDFFEFAVTYISLELKR